VPLSEVLAADGAVGLHKREMDRGDKGVRINWVNSLADCCASDRNSIKTDSFRTMMATCNPKKRV